jgi:TIR domain
MKVFVSYSHRQADWVHGKLEPCLKAGGAEVLIDHRRFVAGLGVVGQMDATQDQAERHVLVLSRDYLASEMCRHEMERAIALDPNFSRQLVLPVRRDDAEPPPIIAEPDALHVDLRNDSDPLQWRLLLEACGASLGATVPDWLAARDEILRLLERPYSVNLVVGGRVAWRGLIEDLRERARPKLSHVDLEDPATVPRRGLIAAILGALGTNTIVPQPPEDLPEFGRAIAALGRSHLALSHFDLAPYRLDYDTNLFSSLRYLIMEKRQLVLLIQSRTPFSALLPRGHPLSAIDIRTVELQAHS